MTATIQIDEAMRHPDLFGPALGDLASWSTWVATLKAAFGLPLTQDELALFLQVAGGRSPPREPVEQLWAIVGRRGGKSRMAALIAVYLATLVDPRVYALAPGETGYVVCLAPTQRQAQLVLGYCRAMIEASPVLSKRIERVSTEEIQLTGNIRISVHAADYRTIRGRTLIGAVCDEAALWRSEESAQPDVEVMRAVVPALMRPDGSRRGMIVGISTPYAERGVLFEKFRDNYGKDSPTLVVRGSTSLFNPGIGSEQIDKAVAEDPEGNRAEYLAEFRGDWSAYIDRDTVMRCIDVGTREREFAVGPRYVAFMDASGGRHDSFALAIAHKVADRVVLDQALEWKAPFDPADVIEDVAAWCRRYRIARVLADNFGAELVVSMLRQHKIGFKATEFNKHEIFLNALPLMTSGTAMLLDQPRLVAQLTQLQRETGRAGRDSIVKVRGSYDDVANACCGALVEAAARRGGTTFAEDGTPIEPPGFTGRVILGHREYMLPTPSRSRGGYPPLRFDAEPIKVPVAGTKYSIAKYGEMGGDGRQRYSIHDEKGQLLGTKWGEEAALQAARYLDETGSFPPWR